MAATSARCWNGASTVRRTDLQLLVYALCALMISLAPAASAQTTDGYHTIQIFPVVVDSASFSQRFTFQVPNGSPATTVSPKYFPGAGTTQASALVCPDFAIPAGGKRVFTSLRAICPDIVGASAFGYLYTSEASSENLPYAGFSRVSNMAGAGFSVEAFPAHTFTSADVVVSGARRLAATASEPAYQTNCFVGGVNDVTPLASPVPTYVIVAVLDSSMVQVSSTAVAVYPGQLTRMLDIFAAVGLGPGNYEDATIRFQPVIRGAGIMAFCTVQDNTSFGADFRIAKQERGMVFPGVAKLASHDDSVTRDSNAYFDLNMSGELERTFELADNAISANTHLYYFRHPDRIQCEVLDPATGQRMQPDGYLEMRLIADDGVTVLAGGNDITGFGEIYLGDKSDRNAGSNSRYTVEVEYRQPWVSICPNCGGMQYLLHCQSGSGHTLGEIVRYRQPIDRF